jgi:alkylation response protein AidB-like acyl-CoA dehydrogenase
MDFHLTAEQQTLRESARRFARAELPDLARRLEETDSPVPQEIRMRYGELGFLGINMPEQYGGLGLGHNEALLVLEQFVHVSPAVAFPVFESATGPVRTVLHFAGEPLKAAILPRVIKGEIVIAVAMSEPNAGTALTDLTTRARFQNGEIILSGQKRWCSGGGHSDAYIVYSRMSDSPGADGIGAVLVEKGRPGLTFGPPERLMGWRGIPNCDIFLDEVHVPLENLIVPAGGFRQLMRAFSLERCGNATMSLGIAAAALEESIEYSQQRRQFGKPIVDFQAVQLKLADMTMKVEAARLLIHKAAQHVSEELPSALDSSVAKCFANEISREVAMMGMQIMGGYGYATESRMEQRVRDALACGIAGGTIDIQKTNIAAELIGRRFKQRS